MGSGQALLLSHELGIDVEKAFIDKIRKMNRSIQLRKHLGQKRNILNYKVEISIGDLLDTCSLFKLEIMILSTSWF